MDKTLISVKESLELLIVMISQSNSMLIKELKSVNLNLNLLIILNTYNLLRTLRSIPLIPRNTRNISKSSLRVVIQMVVLLNILTMIEKFLALILFGMIEVLKVVLNSISLTSSWLMTPLKLRKTSSPTLVKTHSLFF